jgi:hypothetical protein
MCSKSRLIYFPKQKLFSFYFLFNVSGNDTRAFVFLCKFNLQQVKYNYKGFKDKFCCCKSPPLPKNTVNLLIKIYKKVSLNKKYFSKKNYRSFNVSEFQKFSKKELVIREIDFFNFKGRIRTIYILYFINHYKFHYNLKLLNSNQELLCIHIFRPALNFKSKTKCVLLFQRNLSQKLLDLLPRDILLLANFFV